MTEETKLGLTHFLNILEKVSDEGLGKEPEGRWPVTGSTRERGDERWFDTVEYGISGTKLNVARDYILKLEQNCKELTKERDEWKAKAISPHYVPDVLLSHNELQKENSDLKEVIRKLEHDIKGAQHTASISTAVAELKDTQLEELMRKLIKR